MFSRITLLFLGLVGFLLVMGCAQKPSQEQSNASDKTKRVILEVTGMS